MPSHDHAYHKLVSAVQPPQASFNLAVLSSAYCLFCELCQLVAIPRPEMGKCSRLLFSKSTRLYLMAIQTIQQIAVL